MSIYERFESCRRKGETTADLLRRAGNISWRTYLDIKHGSEPRAATIKKMADGLERDPSWLMFGNEADSKAVGS